jgi:YbbR domain-containing protein
VDAALARVRIDPSGLDVTAQVDLVPIDVDGEVVEPIDLSPSSTIVEIEVRQIETNRTLPIAWDLQGTPADGYTIRSVTADPAVVTVRGDPANLIGLAQIPTRPISIEGANENRTFTAQLILPQGVRVVQAEEVTLAVEIAADLGSRTFVVGVVCVDAAPGSSCLPQLDRLSVTLQGPVAALNALTPGDITPFVSAGGIASGSRRAQPAFVLPDGISIVSVSPADVLLTVVGPATPPPTPAPEPPAAP